VTVGPPGSRASRFKTDSPPLSRLEIVDAALAHARAGDLEQLSLRRLAAELDVSPMALYRHVRDKDDILEAVADALLSEAGLPDAALGPADHLVALAVSLRGVLATQPALVDVFGRRPQVGPMAVARLAAARDVLVAAGHRVEEAQRRYAAVHTYTVGYCALDTARRRTGAAAPVVGGDEAVIAGFVTDDQFLFGLHALVAGLG